MEAARENISRYRCCAQTAKGLIEILTSLLNGVKSRITDCYEWSRPRFYQALPPMHQCTPERMTEPFRWSHN